MAPRMVDQEQKDPYEIPRPLSTRTLINQGREQGKTPISVVTVGDSESYRQATGNVTNGSTVRVYLTTNGQSKGESFMGTGIPGVSVLRDMKVTAGGLGRAGGPPSPSGAMQLRSVIFDLIWDGANGVWAVDITNDTGATANYLVQATGVR